MRSFNFNLLPSPADNIYSGHKVAFWFFIAFNALMTWRSIIHMFFEEFGAHGIANLIVLSGDPDPMPLIYSFFSLWGFAQLIFCCVSWIVIFRYKSLISLMYLFYFSNTSNGKLVLHNIFLYLLYFLECHNLSNETILVCYLC